MKTVTLDGGCTVLIDDDDEHFFQNEWSGVKASPDGFIRRRTVVDHKEVVLYFHREITGARRGQEVHFVNGHRNDCRKENLKVMDKFHKANVTRGARLTEIGKRGRRSMGRLEKHNYSEMSLDRINKYRRFNGLPPIEPKQRNCLKCSATFESSGITNRLCRPCSWISNGHTDWGVKSNVRIG